MESSSSVETGGEWRIEDGARIVILSSYKALVIAIGLIYSLYNLITLEISFLLCMGGVGGVRKGNNRVSHSYWSLPGHDDGITHYTKLILSLATRLLALVSSKLAIPHRYCITDKSWTKERKYFITQQRRI